jgi:replication factor A1
MSTAFRFIDKYFEDKCGFKYTGREYMEKEEIAPHVKDITRALENKVENEQVEKELKRYLEVYRVSLETAKRSIVKKYGGNPAALSVGVSKTLKELLANESSVNLLCRIVTSNPKEIEVDSQKKGIIYGILGDPTATLPFTAWETEDLELERGDVIQVQNAYTTEWKGNIQINFGVRTTITKESKDALPPFVPEMQECKIKDFNDGMRNVALTARILGIERREVDISGEKKVVFSGMLGDETGKAQFSSWADFELKENDVVKISGGYIKEWRGIPQLTFDERAEVEKLQIDFPSAEDISQRTTASIEELMERGGAVDVGIEGTVIDVKSGSGLIYRCKECKRVLQDGTCRIHGEVEGAADLRAKVIVDDGSGALTAIFNKEITEQLLNKKLEECIKEKGDNVIEDELTALLTAQPIQARGNVTSDDYGLMMIAKEAEIKEVDVQNEAKRILEELGE